MSYNVGDTLYHKILGEALYSAECKCLDRINPDPSSMHIFHDGEVKEVSVLLITDSPPVTNIPTREAFQIWVPVVIAGEPTGEFRQWYSGTGTGEWETIGKVRAVLKTARWVPSEYEIRKVTYIPRTDIATTVVESTT